MARYWYSYQGGSGTSPTLNEANYVKTLSTPSILCEGAGNVCAVYAYSTNTTAPAPFSPNLQRYIAQAAAFPQPTDIGAQIFVYVKN